MVNGSHGNVTRRMIEGLDLQLFPSLRQRNVVNAVVLFFHQEFARSKHYRCSLSNIGSLCTVTRRHVRGVPDATKGQYCSAPLLRRGPTALERSDPTRPFVSPKSTMLENCNFQAATSSSNPVHHACISV